MKTKNIIERVWEKVEIRLDNECWEWMGCRNSGGYGTISNHGKSDKAHRIVFMLTKGDIPNGYEIDHLCRNRACVNPSHLEVVTKKVNLLRGNGACAKNARKTHCAKGHLLGDAVLESCGWTRRCRICYKNYLKEYHKAHKATKEKK